LSEPRPLPHAMSALPDAAEQARLDFAVAFKHLLGHPIKSALPHIYRERAEPAWAAQHGRAPESWQEVGEALSDTSAYRWWSALARAQQEYYVDVTSTVCERQLPELIERYRAISRAATCGTLTLDPDLAIPPYQSEVDIHCVPGSYFLERTEDDVWAGARSDLGSFVFMMGGNGPLCDDKGQTGAAFLKARFPDFKATRVLDMGCTVGMSTLPYVDAYPEAEVHAIDLSAPSLRFAHARAESLGKAVHFRQANAEHAPYGDGSFDLVVSHILLHELSCGALDRVLAECHRLLRPGGIMLHVEVPIRRKDPLDQFLWNWDTTNNNEPFWSTLAELDLVEPAVRAGFPRESIFEAEMPSLSRKGGIWLGYGARKAGDAQ